MTLDSHVDKKGERDRRETSTKSPASRAFPGEFLSESRSSLSSILAALTKHKKAVLVLSGALCVGGLLFAQSAGGLGGTDANTTTAGQVPTSSVSVEGTASFDKAPTARPTAVSDPRAFALAKALSGELDGDTATWGNAVADVVSRNGDVVLVAVRSEMTDGTTNELSVLLVRTESSWVVREVYSEVN